MDKVAQVLSLVIEKRAQARAVEMLQELQKRAQAQQILGALVKLAEGKPSVPIQKEAASGKKKALIALLALAGAAAMPGSGVLADPLIDAFDNSPGEYRPGDFGNVFTNVIGRSLLQQHQ